MTTYAEPEALARPLPQNLDDWPRLIYRDRARPSASDDRSKACLAALIAYNAALGPLVTDDVTKVRKLIEQAHFENDHASLAGQRCVVIDGVPLVGKTQASLSVAFRETKAVWGDQPPGVTEVDSVPLPARQVPWIYVEVVTGSKGFGILSGMHRFCGIPHDPRDNADALLARLRKLAGPMGVRGVLIDDAHGISGGRTKDSVALADMLKGIITGLPFTVVIIGAGLAQSGFLNGRYGEQVRHRSLWTTLGEWQLPSRKEPGPWGRMLAGLDQQLAFPADAPRSRLNTPGAISTLIEGSERRPGLAIEWAKAAANHAIRHHVPFGRDALDATRPIPAEGPGRR
ncbi:hypothetical protein [Nocardioides sp. GXZ039]|uniref:hypothetical protein n=1 Tax=Nocardioides sp. GXZ039 TaxID=3136018 RepID=UPI0030F3BCBE